MVIKSLFDQSVFVTSSLIAVLREGAIAAGLTALMILLFLGSWRPTIVVMISIPLAMLTSLVVLYFLGETINTMTLGGLALAVGILVDNSTVTIENTYRLLDEEKMPLPRATLHGAAEIAVPTLVSTLAISCVFTSVVFLEGPAKYLFTPLGLAVVFAMLASYGLSRTLTPITIGLLLKGQHARRAPPEMPAAASSPASTPSFERGFERLREGYVGLLTMLLTRRAIVPIVAVLVLALGAVMFVFCRPRFLSGDRWRHDPAPCPRAAGHPHRGDRADLPGGRGQDPPGHSEKRPRSDRRQFRGAGALL